MNKIKHLTGKVGLGFLASLAATALANAQDAKHVATTAANAVSPAVASTAAVPTAAPATAPAAAPSAQTALVRAGETVVLRMKEMVTTKDKSARVGQRVQMEVASPVYINNQLVIPEGAPAVGEITSVTNKGMWGKSGKLEGRALFVRVNGQQVRLTGSFDDKGVAGTGGVVAAVVFLPVAGFFVTGTSAELPIGAQVKAFVDEDITLPVLAAPQTAGVPQAAPSPAAATTPASGN